jgi:Fe2+ or Zn2+ uptake regulation protein
MQITCISRLSILILLMMGRQTKAKEEVENIFSSTKTPLSLKDLHVQIQTKLPNVAFSTLYRIVQGFEKDAKILKVDWKERGSCYEWAKMAHHHHVVCEKCNNVTDLDDQTLNYNEKVIVKKTGFLVKHHSIEILGVCPTCQKGMNS